MPLQRRQMPHLLRNLLMPQDDDKTVSDSEEALAADAVDESATAEVPTSAENKSDEVSQLLQKLDEATTQAKTHREDYLRAVAELDNFRKRALREKDEVRLRASSAVLEDFLPVLDNFALGLSAARQHEAGKAFAEGFAMVLNQFESLLRQHGVEEIAPQGEARIGRAHAGPGSAGRACQPSATHWLSPPGSPSTPGCCRRLQWSR